VRGRAGADALARRPGRGLAGACLLLLWLATPSARAQSGFRVVVNASNPVASMTADEVSDVFLGKTERWESGARVGAVDLPADSRARARFSKAVHGKDVDAIKKYWRKIIFSGLGSPPEELGSDAAVLDFVAHNVGAIGYVSAGTPLEGQVKALEVTELR
jgi:ABC-type phosphate transport system substrate-binding protein